MVQQNQNRITDTHTANLITPPYQDFRRSRPQLNVAQNLTHNNHNYTPETEMAGALSEKTSLFGLN